MAGVRGRFEVPAGGHQKSPRDECLLVASLGLPLLARLLRNDSPSVATADGAAHNFRDVPDDGVMSGTHLEGSVIAGSDRPQVQTAPPAGTAQRGAAPTGGPGAVKGETAHLLSPAEAAGS